MAAIRISELSKWLADTYGAGVELEPSTFAEDIARIFVHHFAILADGSRRAAEWLTTYTPWITVRDREAMISEAASCQIKWKADTLGWKLGLTEEQRARLKITTIGARGVNKQMRIQRRNKAKAERERARRAAKRTTPVSTI